jgi:ABC-type multidrug transport system permease subunit
VTLLQELDKIYFFMKRDVLSFSTYKTNILLSVLSALFGALSYAFLGANAQMQSVLNSYHINFTTYLLIVGSSMWGFIWSTLVIAIYLAVGVFAFGVVLSVNIVGTVLVVALGIATFIGFSMIGAGILILTKQGDPITTIITIATNLFGNVLFPPQVMPQALQVISYFVPQYYFFTTIRQVLTGAALQTILPDLLVLILMCAVILPLGYFVYSWCLRTAKKNGTLSWF